MDTTTSTLFTTFAVVQTKLSGWIEAAITMLPNFVGAIAVVVLFWALGRLIGGLAQRQLKHLTEHKQARALISSTLRLGILGAGIVIALGILQLDKTVASLLAGVGVMGLALGFAFQDIASNFMAGVILIIRRPFAIGDLIQSGDFFGHIESLNIRSTVGRTLQGQEVRIPNRQVLGNAITNFTTTGQRRIDLSCGVSYGDDLQRAEDLAKEAVESVPERLPERPIDLFYEEFGDSSINFSIRFWIPADHPTFLAARSNAIKAIKLRFDEHGITIPFPIRTLDFGIVGGQTLSEQLSAAQQK